MPKPKQKSKRAQNMLNVIKLAAKNSETSVEK